MKGQEGGSSRGPDFLLRTWAAYRQTYVRKILVNQARTRRRRRSNAERPAELLPEGRVEDGSHDRASRDELLTACGHCPRANGPQPSCAISTSFPKWRPPKHSTARSAPSRAKPRGLRVHSQNPRPPGVLSAPTTCQPCCSPPRRTSPRTRRESGPDARPHPQDPQSDDRCRRHARGSRPGGDDQCQRQHRDHAVAHSAGGQAGARVDHVVRVAVRGSIGHQHPAAEHQTSPSALQQEHRRDRVQHGQRDEVHRQPRRHGRVRGSQPSTRSWTTVP